MKKIKCFFKNSDEIPENIQSNGLDRRIGEETFSEDNRVEIGVVSVEKSAGGVPAVPVGVARVPQSSYLSTYTTVFLLARYSSRW